MLLEFQVENFKSFKNKTVLSMLAAGGLKELKNNVVSIDKLEILKTTAIYGANASGKSNLIDAINFMQFFVKSSHLSKLNSKIQIENFLLSTETEKQPSKFEATFLTENTTGIGNKTNIIVRYGFLVSYEKVIAEWLFIRFSSQESKIFTRYEDEYEFGEKFKVGRKFYRSFGKISEKSLFISQLLGFKGESSKIANTVATNFYKLHDITFIADFGFFPITGNMLDDPKYKEKIIKALCLADTGIEDVIVETSNFKQDENDEIPLDTTNTKIKKKLGTIHFKYDKNQDVVGKVKFDFKQESDGTRKFFALLGPIIDALENGVTLVIDEIGAKLHPNLCQIIISLFNSEKVNINKAQLIFSTHNPVLMNNKLRRDQIYIIEKNSYGSSKLYSLADFGNIRNGANFMRDYLFGKYGGVPYLGDFEQLFGNDDDVEDIEDNEVDKVRTDHEYK